MEKRNTKISAIISYKTMTCLGGGGGGSRADKTDCIKERYKSPPQKTVAGHRVLRHSNQYNAVKSESTIKNRFYPTDDSSAPISHSRTFKNSTRRNPEN